MSNWTHCICHDCWVELKGDRIPTRVVGAEPQGCCRCGKPTNAGIFLRESPGKFQHCSESSVHDEEG